MLRFILRRLLFLIPALIILSWVAFALSQCTPGDPVSRILPQEELLLDNDPLAYERLYLEAARQLKRDGPVFYFSLNNYASAEFGDDFVLPEQQRWLQKLSQDYGKAAEVHTYFEQLRELSIAGPQVLATPARELLIKTEASRIEAELASLQLAAADSTIQAEWRQKAAAVQQQWQQISEQPARANLLWPRFRWHGSNNQYHHWLMAALQGDLGISYQDRQAVGDKLWSALKWTLLLNSLALLIAYGVAIPLGLKMGQRADSRFDRRTNFLLLLLFSLPSFWVATLVANFFTTPYYGMDWFPSMGLGEIKASFNWLDTLWIRAQHLFLPVMMLAYPSWAYLSRQMRAATIQELKQPYVQTARLKGLSWPQILRRHVLRNALFPIITMLGSLLPSLLAGSVLIESIFNIPGMGRLLVSATLARDWPVVTSILLLSGIATILGLLLADVLYRWADPRLRRAAANTGRA
ncbi:MAG: ABC transporter permease subunit [Bacteroidota bacterium]